MDEQAVKQTIAGYFAAFKDRDADAYAACFAEDGAVEEPVGKPPKRGHAAIRDFIAEMMGRFDVMELNPERTIINLPSAAIFWKGRGVPKAGEPFDCEGIEVMDFTPEGKISYCRAFV